ncbi:MAG TPA: periplasmic heavy metal sensor [Magnetospirillaceae bacterium]|nr:periplasmic heavy metal sensor [Magnetospirillaceae bacterium]
MWGKIARWLLPASLALNLFFVVLAFRHHPFLHPHPPNAGNIVDFMKPNLPPADAEILQKSFEAHKAAMDEAHKAGQDFPEKIRAALTANPFNPDALTQALRDGQTSHQVIEDAMASALVDAATKMTPEGRAALAARHQFGPGGPGPRGPGFPHGGPPPSPSN